MRKRPDVKICSDERCWILSWISHESAFGDSNKSKSAPNLGIVIYQSVGIRAFRVKVLCIVVFLKPALFLYCILFLCKDLILLWSLLWLIKFLKLLLLAQRAGYSYFFEMIRWSFGYSLNMVGGEGTFWVGDCLQVGVVYLL